ncbi:RICIN domain-containing protein [Kitasatospora sp. NPDC005856]|uniref:RICIN domain-containing protein n=1 Tax=Kitasatospora sp. NPDC005856 TaxID=3154566 RepID=UPI0033DB8652
MGSAGRPQGQLKGRTEQANALARFVQELTRGTTVRKLAQRYPGGKTSWSEYRSAEKGIPWHLLQQLVLDRAPDPRARAVLLERARDLHEQAARAAEALPPGGEGEPTAHHLLDRARLAQRRAEAGEAEAEELIRVLVAIVAELRGELGAGAAERVEPPAPGPDGEGAAQLRRSRLFEATRCLTEVRRIRESARRVRQAAADWERAAVGVLGDQENAPAMTDGGRQPEADQAVAGGVAAHLPVLRGVEGDLVVVREALAEWGREVALVARSVEGPRVVEGELVRTVDHHPPAGTVRIDWSAASRRSRTRRTGVAKGAAGAFLAMALVLAGMLVGMRVGTGVPFPVSTAPQAAGARAVPEADPAAGASSPTTTSPPASAAPAPTPSGRTADAPSATTSSSTTPAAPAVTGTPAAPTSTAVGVPPEPGTPSPGAVDRSGPPPVPPVSAPAPTRLGGAPLTPPTGPVAIRNGNSRLCVSTPGGTRDEGSEVHQYPCGDFPDHFWEARKAYTDAEGDTYHQIVSYNSALCLSVQDSSTDVGAPVIQSACRNDPGQAWRIEKWPHGNRFVNGRSHQCLAVSYGSSAPQAPLTQYPCGDYPDHYWTYGALR